MVHAFHINEDFAINGHPYHIEHSPDIQWEAKRITLPSAAAVEAEEEKMQKSDAKNFGVRVVAVPRLRPGKQWPRKHDSAPESTEQDESYEKGAEKIAEVGKSQDEKARQRLIEMGLEPQG